VGESWEDERVEKEKRSGRGEKREGEERRAGVGCPPYMKSDLPIP
jgi:hypothetical protein